jgi:uncharacterized protein (DUF4415 family)
MQKSERIVRYAAEELDEKLRRGEDLTDWAALDALTEEELEASIDFEEEGYPIWESMVARNFRPKEEISLRLDSDIVAWFKEQGPEDYQIFINEVLRTYVDAKKKQVNTEKQPDQ